MPLFRSRPDAAAGAPADGDPAAAAAPDPVPWTPPPVPADLPDPLLADIATNLWRAGKRLAAPVPDAGAERALRAAARHLRAAVETFAQAGVAVQDHDGTPFDPGLSLEVVAYEPRADAARETVLETVRPCVYRSGRRIQIGQVIVAQPEKPRRPGRRS